MVFSYDFEVNFEPVLLFQKKLFFYNQAKYMLLGAAIQILFIYNKCDRQRSDGQGHPSRPSGLKSRQTDRRMDRGIPVYLLV
jgi:hypothetical protein